MLNTDHYAFRKPYPLTTHYMRKCIRSIRSIRKEYRLILTQQFILS